MWRHFGYADEPKTSCCAPWRDDHKPSFSVSADGRLWNDFGTGEGGDAIDFLVRASGLSRADACRKFLELVGAGYTAPARTPVPAGKPHPKFPPFARGTAADFQQLASFRNGSAEALHLARERGLLRFAVLHGLPAWIATDGERLNAQARRMDGGRWAHDAAGEARHDTAAELLHPADPLLLRDRRLPNSLAGRISAPSE